MRHPNAPAAARPPRRRGFNLVELLIALAISAALLTATMVALNASFTAYQTTTEVASTHTVGRLAMHRMLTLIRTGSEFEPRPLTPAQAIIQSDYIDFRMPDGSVLALEWVDSDNALYAVVGGYGGTRYTLLEGVEQPLDPDGDPIPPFTLEYQLGHELYRATIDLTIRPDDNQAVEIDGDNAEFIRLVASAMPRNSAYE
jgi:prepilin-type N-terminal cleavage/methylation domain-containing protein